MLTVHNLYYPVINKFNFLPPQAIFDEGYADYVKGGVKAMTVDKFAPPVSGTLKWIHKLRSRIQVPHDEFPFLEVE